MGCFVSRGSRRCWRIEQPGEDALDEPETSSVGLHEIGPRPTGPRLFFTLHSVPAGFAHVLGYIFALLRPGITGDSLDITCRHLPNKEAAEYFRV